MFSFSTYLQRLRESNRLAKTHRFAFGTCSSMSNLQEALANLRKFSAYVIACDVNNGGTTKINGGWQQRRIFTFFIIKQYKFNDEKDRNAQMEICREVRRQFLSRFLHDMSSAAATDVDIRSSNINFNLDDVPSNEYPDMMLNSCCGLNVSIEVREPVNLCYNEAEWS